MKIDQLQKAAEEYADKYDDRFKKVARNSFIDAVCWAIQVANREIQLR